MQTTGRHLPGGIGISQGGQGMELTALDAVRRPFARGPARFERVSPCARSSVGRIRTLRNGASAAVDGSHGSGATPAPWLFDEAAVQAAKPSRGARNPAQKEKPPGSGLFSHAVAGAVSSTLQRFTSVFGMGTGGSVAL